MNRASSSRARSIFTDLQELEDDSFSTERADEEKDEKRQSSYLTPLQSSLIFELTTRRKRIEIAERRVEFWEKNDEKERGISTTTDLDLDEEYLDDLIKQRRARLTELQQSQRLKESIVESADAAHSINASMSAVPPSGFSSNLNSPLCVDEKLPLIEQPLRSIAAKRDENALNFLQLQDEKKKNEKEKDAKLREIQSIRQQTSSLAKEIQKLKKEIEEKKTQEIDLSTSTEIDRQEDAQRRIHSLQNAIAIAKGKREMVKGVVRGLILESGLDWHKSKKIRKLVLSLGDDEVYSSDEDVDLYSDEEQRSVPDAGEDDEEE